MLAKRARSKSRVGLWDGWIDFEKDFLFLFGLSKRKGKVSIYSLQLYGLDVFVTLVFKGGGRYRIKPGMTPNKPLQRVHDPNHYTSIEWKESTRGIIFT